MKPFLIALALSRALDATTSCVGLARGLEEANPLMPRTCAPQVAVQATVSLTTLLLLWKLAPTHPKLAKGLAVLGTSVEVVVGVHNIALLVSLPR